MIALEDLSDPSFAVLVMGGIFCAMIVLLLSRGRRGRRRCKWRQSETGSRGALIKYRCRTCGSEAYSGKGKPDRCMAAFKSPGL